MGFAKRWLKGTQAALNGAIAPASLARQQDQRIADLEGIVAILHDEITEVTARLKRLLEQQAAAHDNLAKWSSAARKEAREEYQKGLIMLLNRENQA